MRRLMHAVSVFALAALMLGGGGVAYADPTPPPTPSPSSPTPSSGGSPLLDLPGVRDITEALCTRPPAPDRPNGRAAGKIDPGPPKPGPTETYGDTWYESRGYSGFQLPIYDPGCAPSVNAVQKRIVDGPNWLAETLIGLALVEIAAGTVTARYVLEVHEGIWAVLDRAVGTVNVSVALPIMTNFLLVSILLAAIVMAWRVRTESDVPWVTRKAAGLTGISVLAILMVTNSFVLGPTYDEGARQVTRAVSASSTLGQDAQTADVAIADGLIRGLVFPLWADALLGDNKAAIDEFGWRLYAAGGMTRNEADFVDTYSTQTDRVSTAAMTAYKRHHYRAVAKELQAKYPDAYERLKGESTGPRVGSPVLLLLAMTLITAPLLGALLAIGCAKVVFRAALAALPVGAVLYVQPGWQRHVPRILRIVWAFTVAGFVGLIVYLVMTAAVIGIAISPDATYGEKLLLLVLLGSSVIAAWKFRDRLPGRNSRTVKTLADAKQIGQAVQHAVQPLTAPVVAAAGAAGARVGAAAGTRSARRGAASGVTSTRKGRTVRADTVHGIVARHRDDAARRRKADAEAAKRTRAAREKALDATYLDAATARASGGKGSRAERRGRRLRRTDVTATSATNATTSGVTPARRAPVRRPVVKTPVSKTASVVAPAVARPLVMAAKIGGKKR